MVAVKLIPHLLAFFGMVVILARGYATRRSQVKVASATGFTAGVVGTALLAVSFSSSLTYAAIKSVLGVAFFLFWAIAVTAVYRATARRATAGFWGERFFASAPCALGISGLCALTAGAVCGCLLTNAGSGGAHLLLLLPASLAVGYLLAWGAQAVETKLPASLKVTQLGMLAGGVSLLLFSASSLPRLDLFSPLSMKVMKGVHDFVHQSMESVLIPDHLFVKPVVWKFLGFLFGKEVGFWGGMVIWFTPCLLIALAVGSRRLPSVAHIRQGAERRKVLAGALRDQRLQLLMPLFSLAVFAVAAYQSSFPSVEYWDPKPLPVAANQAGEIVIPKKGEVNLEDGNLHKFLYKQGGREARFFVLMTPAGQLTVDLDACAICKPDGYGQAEGTVICYYCKTLIPLETVGKPGGCNPVPVAFKEKGDGVVIDGMTLINTWGATVQATSRAKEGGK